jgi:CMP-N-acetylneuraminic acid synthetase|tara:strand:- start:55 stop:759 length:705 start_codon:yes stop_codon:yes gene_type:complete
MKKKDNFWAFIPARSGSKTIKNKNIIKFKGKPLMAHSIITAKKLKIFDKIIVSSDSKKYLNIAKKFGSNFLNLRSKKLSGDKTTDLEVFVYFLNDLKKRKISPPKYFIHLRPTTPIRKISIIKKGINYFLKHKKKYTAMRSVSVMSNPSYKTMRVKNKKLCSIINKDFDLDKLNKPKEFYETTYLPNGYIDIIKTANIKNKKLHGNKVLPYIINEFNSDIDSIEDLKYVDYRIK